MTETAESTLDVALFRGETAAEMIPIAMIEPWSENPRKTLDQDAIVELANSIGKVGVLQPILVRPIRDGAMFGIVSGERRWRAARFAGLARIPAVVRTLTDVEALEIAVTENLQREDVPPLEEAEGYARLQSRHGYTVQEIADKVGKSRTYVYARLKLADLCEEARQLVREHHLSPTVALLIARIPTPSQQVEAAKTCAAGPDAQPLSATRAAQVIRGRYMLRLADASFPTDNADFVAAAGACTTCPKRTGNQPELFGDIQEADTCTDGGCFEGKAQRWFDLQGEEHEAKGGKVIRSSAEEWAMWFRDYVDDASVVSYDNARRTWGEIMALAKKPPPHVLVQEDYDEPKWVRAWPRKVAAKVAEKLGIEPKREDEEDGDDDDSRDANPCTVPSWQKVEEDQRAWHVAAVEKLLAKRVWDVVQEQQLLLFLALVWIVDNDVDEALGISLQLQSLGLNILDDDHEDEVASEDVLEARIREMQDLKTVEKAVRLVTLMLMDARRWLPAIAAAHDVKIGEMPHAQPR